MFNFMLMFTSISLSLNAGVGSDYFQEDVMKLYQRDDNAFKERLCFLENVDTRTTLKTLFQKFLTASVVLMLND